jgi:hypothetical protein
MAYKITTLYSYFTVRYVDAGKIHPELLTFIFNSVEDFRDLYNSPRAPEITLCNVLEQILHELYPNHVIGIDLSDFLNVSDSAATKIHVISITCLLGVWILHLLM